FGRLNGLSALVALPGPAVRALRGLPAVASSLHLSAGPFCGKLPLPSLAEPTFFPIDRVHKGNVNSTRVPCARSMILNPAGLPRCFSTRSSRACVIVVASEVFVMGTAYVFLAALRPTPSSSIAITRSSPRIETESMMWPFFAAADPLELQIKVQCFEIVLQRHFGLAAVLQHQPHQAREFREITRGPIGIVLLHKRIDRIQRV